MGHEGIQARRRLVAEHERRIGQHLGGEGQPLHLSPREALRSAGYTDRGVSALGQGELRSRAKGREARERDKKKKTPH